MARETVADLIVFLAVARERNFTRINFKGVHQTGSTPWSES